MYFEFSFFCVLFYFSIPPACLILSVNLIKIVYFPLLTGQKVKVGGKERQQTKIKAVETSNSFGKKWKEIKDRQLIWDSESIQAIVKIRA